MKRAIVLCIAAIVLIGGVVMSNNISKAEKATLGEKPKKGEAAARPIVRNGTVYTAWGTKIRGMNVTVPNITETGEPGMVPKAEDLAQAPLNGMNCIKLAIHGPDVDPDWLSGGSLYENNITYADWFVDTTEELGIYAIICLQTGGDPFQPEFVYDFWNLFAERYKDRTHVFFDITNELSTYSDENTAPVNTPELAATAYEIIRKHAPDTLCIFWSFSHLIPTDEILHHIEKTEALVPGGIPWTNEVIGVHAYEGTNGYYPENEWVHLEVFRSEMRKLAASGYPLFNTEVPNMQFGYNGAINLSNYPNAQMLKVLEEEDVAWTCSLDIAWIRESSIWRGNIERAKLTWEPDYGEWPKPDLLDPYMPHSTLAEAAEYYDAAPSMSEASSMEEMGNTDMNAIPSFFVGSDSWVRFEKLNFGTLEPYSLTVRARGFDDELTIVAHEGGTDGPIICEIPIRKTPGETVAYTAILTRAISGTKDITFTFRDRDGANNWALMYFVDWEFNLSPVTSESVHTDIYAGAVPAVNYSFRQGNIIRKLSDDSNAKTDGGREAKVSGITDGSAILFDRVAFTPDAVAFEVRAKALAGGQIDVYANWGLTIRPWYWWSFPLGSCKIERTDGEWATYTYTIDPELLSDVVYRQYPIHVLDLVLVFTAAEEGDTGDQELFEISEFSFIGVDETEPGVQPSGWTEDDKGRKYKNEEGQFVKGWLKIDGAWYYFDDEAYMVTGWLQDDGKWYFLRERGKQGIMHIGWIQAIGDDNWYYMGQTGVRCTNKWIGDYYLLDSGIMATNQWIGEYYVGDDGKWIPDYEN